MAAIPGPWYRARNELVNRWVYADDHAGTRVVVAKVYPEGEQCEDTAALIAAAPALLAACKEMAGILHSMSEGGVGAAQGIAAPYLEVIRKAEGKE